MTGASTSRCAPSAARLLVPVALVLLELARDALARQATRPGRSQP